MTDSYAQETYGYANRETYMVVLWMYNDEKLQTTMFRKLGSNPNLSDLEEFWKGTLDLFAYSGKIPQLILSMAYDIGSLWRVDWQQVKAVYLEYANT